MILIHQRYRQTDGRTDWRTTCNLNTALCTSASRGKNTHWLSAMLTLLALFSTTAIDRLVGVLVVLILLCCRGLCHVHCINRGQDHLNPRTIHLWKFWQGLCNIILTLFESDVIWNSEWHDFVIMTLNELPLLFCCNLLLRQWFRYLYLYSNIRETLQMVEKKRQRTM